MNKYQKALNEIINCAGCLGCTCENVDLLQELVDKATPKKPINKTKIDDYASLRYENRNIIVCPCCGKRLKLKSKGKYCDKCGQKLDWSELND